MTTDQRIATLETHLDTLRTTQAELRGELRQARVDRWQDRIDDLELQVRLGVAEGSERVTQARATLHTTWDKARAQMQGTSADATSAAQAVQTSLHGAYDDVRAALVDAKNSLTR